jgi:hypothetical protein
MKFEKQPIFRCKKCNGEVVWGELCWACQRANETLRNAAAKPEITKEDHRFLKRINVKW